MYAEFYISSNFLRAALNEIEPSPTIEIRETNTAEGGRLTTFCVVRGGDLTRFESGLDGDGTVDEWRRLSGENGRRLYRIQTPQNSDDSIAYRKVIRLDGFLLSARASDSGWYVKANFPDRDAFRHYRVELGDYDIDVEPTVIRDGGYHPPSEPFGISPEQEEILAEAVKLGYFEIPRGASLEELAGEVDISDQAASERLRRAQATLAENAVCYFHEGSAGGEQADVVAGSGSVKSTARR
jgi:predicted DNA binding protein